MSLKEEIDMIKEPKRWPYYPFLPVKRRISRDMVPEVGVVYADDPTKVYQVGYYNLGTSPSDHRRYPHLQYPNVEAMVATGWIVD